MSRATVSSTGHSGKLRMQGNPLFRQAVDKLAATAHTALSKIGLTDDSVDWIVPHQANIRIIKGTAKKMGVPMERVIVTVQDHGNTSAASIPIALDEAVRTGKIHEGDIVLMTAFGAGLTWAASVVRW